MLVALVIDEALQTVALGETIVDTLAMFEDPTCKIARHAGVERAVWPVRHDVDPAAPHLRMLHGVDGRDKPGHDGVGDYRDVCTR